MPLMQENAEELEPIPLDLDLAGYQQLQDSDQLKVITRRRDGKLVGYVLLLLFPSLRKRNMVEAVVDALYVTPAHRRGSADLLTFTKKIAKHAGASRLAVSSRATAPIDKFLIRNNMYLLEQVFLCEL